MPEAEQYPITDLLMWMDDKTLILNTNFQRRAVWPPTAMTYLIDTILRDRPMPNVYVRTKTDLQTRRSYREVVDGQQRLRTIHEFASGKFALGKGAREFAGKRYNDLDDDMRAAFLSYRVGVVQLFNASDDQVLDVFHRINAYGLSLNHQELRHGKFQGAFRNGVVEASRRWSLLWDKYQIVGVRDRVRMADDELIAQMLGVILEGVVDGGQPAINKLYQGYDAELPPQAEQRLDVVVEFMVSELAEILETSLSRPPHFLMLFAALANALVGIPPGDMRDDMPRRDDRALSDMLTAKANLGILADVLDMSNEEVPGRFFAFKLASAGSTQRIRSRAIRFATMYRALLPEPV